MTHILKSHPGVGIISEPYIARLEQDLDDAQAAELLLLLKYVSTELSQKKVIGIAEKAGMFIHGNFDRLIQYFADRIILVVRDPRDCLVSAREKWFSSGKKSSFVDEDDYLVAYANLVGWCDEKNQEGIPLLPVRYEDLVQNTREVVEKILRFVNCNQQFDETMYQAARNHFTSRGDRKLKEVGGIPHTKSLGRWKSELSSADLDMISQHLENVMLRFNYSE